MGLGGPLEVDNLKANIVVIGGGGGGLAAATVAAEKEVTDIIVLEKLGKLGGNSGLNTAHHGIFAVESPVQKREKIDAPRDKFFKMAMDWAHWKINPRIVRAFIDKSGDTIRWLEEKGMKFDCFSYYPEHKPTWHVPKGDFPDNESGANLIETLANECKRLGVQLLIRTPAKKILTGAKGNIIGVLAETKGKEFTIQTNNVIIASGGFSGNKTLLKKYCPDYRDNMRLAEALPHQGDGLLMAIAMGAATEGLGTLHLMGPVAHSAAHSEIFLQVEDEPNKIPVRLIAITSLPYMVWVNKRGERFADESISKYHFESCNVAVQQPDNVTYAIFDSKMLKTIGEYGVSGYIIDKARGKKLKGLETELSALVDENMVKISDSWDEIADWIGAEHNVLNATIDEYNAACNQGYDRLFAKERKYLVPLLTPPYYAIRCHVFFAGTIGGIKINEHMEIIDKRGNPILGLYAAGVDTGGWESQTYCPTLPGSALGFAVNSGRIAGENAAKFALEQNKGAFPHKS